MSDSEKRAINYANDYQNKAKRKKYTCPNGVINPGSYFGFKAGWDEAEEYYLKMIQRWESSTVCPNQCELPKEEVVNDYESHGVTVKAKGWLCQCGMSWMSGRQYSRIDMDIIEVLANKIKELEK